jgi:hypothetical protein
MKASAKCPKCGKFIETDCEGCIDKKGFECATGCSCDLEEGIKINWNKIPENEKDLREIENEI